MSAQPGTVIFSDPSSEFPDDFSLLDILDHVLNQGIIIRGNLVISLAGVDLVYLGLDVILTSVETAMRHIAPSAPAKQLK
jgi:Gas vesicle protein